MKQYILVAAFALGFAVDVAQAGNPYYTPPSFCPPNYAVGNSGYMCNPLSVRGAQFVAYENQVVNYQNVGGTGHGYYFSMVEPVTRPKVGKCGGSFNFTHAFTYYTYTNVPTPVTKQPSMGGVELLITMGNGVQANLQKSDSITAQPKMNFDIACPSDPAAITAILDKNGCEIGANYVIYDFSQKQACYLIGDGQQVRIGL